MAIDLSSLVEQTVTGLGYELVDFETSPRGRLLRVLIDAPAKEGGVAVDDCALVSNQLTRVFAVEDVDYDRLEVSSPGLDRPLKKPADFERFAGQEAQVRLRVPINGQRNFTGVLGGLENGRLRLLAAAGTLSFDLAQVEKARLVPKF